MVSPSGELVYGVHPILELLRAKRRSLIMVYTTRPEPKAWRQIAPLLSSRTKVAYVDRNRLTSLVQTNDHQGIVALAMPYQFRKKPFDPIKNPFLLLLDGVQDVRNLGAIIRSAYCTNISGIIVPAKTSAPLNAAALKASAGLAEYVEIYQPSSTKAAVLELKKAGYELILAVPTEGRDATTVSYKKPLCLVIGGEGFGITPDILSAGIPVTLPMRGTHSYNASVAAGILLFLIGHSLGLNSKK